MGCTSSAPNMANSTTPDKNVQLDDSSSDDNSKDIEEIIYRAADKTDVLPKCDTIQEPVNLVRNKSTPSINNGKDKLEDSHVSESISKVESNVSIHQEEKTPRLEEVVDKVFGLHTEHIDDTPVELAEEPMKADDPPDKPDLNEDIKTEEDKHHTASEEVQDHEKEEVTEEAISPSQSESSRATRWEALADIAAELPPSLTVDPITGQIYSLAK